MAGLALIESASLASYPEYTEEKREGKVEKCNNIIGRTKSKGKNVNPGPTPPGKKQRHYTTTESYLSFICIHAALFGCNFGHPAWYFSAASARVACSFASKWWILKPKTWVVLPNSVNIIFKSFPSETSMSKPKNKQTNTFFSPSLSKAVSTQAAGLRTPSCDKVKLTTSCRATFFTLKMFLSYWA